jgi:hypothetical protein
MLNERRLEMIIISMISNPPESGKEMIKRSMQLPRLPEYIKTIGPFVRSAIGEGIKTLTIYEFDDSKYPEASKHIYKLLGSFYGVPGFTFSLEVWLRAKEAYQSFGLT